MKWRLRNERRNSILMTHHFPDLGSYFWLVENLLHPIRSTIQIRVVTHYQYRISVFVPQTPFRGETSGWVAKCSLFSQANLAILKKKTKTKNTYRYLLYLPFLAVIFVCSMVAHTQEYIFKITLSISSIFTSIKWLKTFFHFISKTSKTFTCTNQG